LASGIVGGEWSASRPDRFSSRERDHGTQWLVNHRDGLDDKREVKLGDKFVDENRDISVSMFKFTELLQIKKFQYF
jgi:hypothetical protein